MRQRREHFKITRWARRYDKRSGKFVVDIAYTTATDITPRTIAVSEAFGVGVDQEQKFVVYDNVELKIGPKDIVLITGDSGSGKSVLLKALAKDIQDNRAELGDVVDISDVAVNQDKPLIETVGKTVEEGLELLSRVGLNDAFLFVRRFRELSDGQKYRYRIAKMIELGGQWWIMDEFCATLDRDTAKIVAFNVQKLARQTGRAVLAATTHTDLFEDLAPSMHVHKRYGKEIQITYFHNSINMECSLVKDMCVVKANLKEYEKLSGFHYRDSKGIVAAQKVFVLKRGEEAIGAIVYTSPGVAALGRLLAVGRQILLKELNKDWTLISRVVVHPKYRSIGLGAKLVKETLFKSGYPYTESIAVMAKYNPFFEHAGMTKIAESPPNKQVLATLKSLEATGFNPTYMGSEAYNLHHMQDSTTVGLVKETLKLFSRRNGCYRKRLLSLRKAFPTHQEFCEIVDKADAVKLAKILRILSFLAQPKVYLFWKSPALDFLKFLSEEKAKVAIN